MISRPEDVEAVAQEVFLRLYFSLDGAATSPPGGSFSLPILVNGNVYVPAYGISAPGTSPNCSSGSASAVSGLLVFCNPSSTACYGTWQ